MIDERFNLAGCKILIAEDEQLNFELLKIYLEDTGALISNAENGKETIDTFMANPDIDIILMDIKMPVMNGYEATRIIKKIDPRVIIIAQTAYALPADRKFALEAGCNDYLSKPIRREELLSKIDTCLTQRNNQPS
ncbi:MAG: response regulator [Bacteroidetes bacterium]|nr:response regulator [Bacteroidota bacterium]